jgi:diguanylate cyclase (GGDEF)-like protein/PAS domain S-box-containing protein
MNQKSFAPSGVDVDDRLNWAPSSLFLKVALVTLLTGSLVMIPVMRMVAPDQVWRMLGPVFGALVAGLSWLFAARGNYYVAARIFAVGAWLIVSMLAMLVGGVRTPVVMVYPVIIMLVGWLYNVRTTLAVAGLTGLTIAGLTIAEIVGITPQLPETHPLIYGVFELLVSALATIMIVFLARSYKTRLQELQAVGDAFAKRTADLEASQARLDMAIKATQIVFWHCDFVKDQLVYDNIILRWMGLPEDSGPKTLAQWLERIHPEDQGGFVERLARAKDTPGLALDMEYRLATHTHGWVWVHTSGAIVQRDAAGLALTAGGGTVNISQRKEAEFAIKASESLLRSTLDSIDEGVLLVSNVGKVLSVNRRFKELWRVPESIIEIGEDGALLAHVVEQLLEPEEFLNIVHKLYGGNAEERDTVTFKDGRVFTRFTRVLAIGNDSGRIWCFRDISAQVRAQTAIAASHNLLLTVIDTAPMRVFWKDKNLHYLGCNKVFAQDAGLLHPRELIGKDDYQMGWAAQAEQYRSDDRAVMQLGVGKLSYDEVQTTPDGQAIWLRTSKVPLKDANNETMGIVGMYEDITEHKRAEENLHLAASVFGHAREAIMITSASGEIVDANEAFTRITGYARDEVLGKNPRIMSSGRQKRDFYATLWTDLATQGHWVGEVWNRRKNGEVFAVMQTISAVRDTQGALQHYVSLFSDITALKEHQHQLEHIAHFDALTNLPNRSLLADRLQQGMAQTQRRGKLLAVAYLDLDGFKAINDNYGHDAGDHLLITLASRMKQALREGDTLARMGGDEFVAVLVDLPDVTASEPLLTRLLAAAAQPVQLGHHTLQVSASLGVTFCPQTDDVDADQMLRQADQAMYQAKLSGKNRYHVFDAAQDRSVRGHHESLESIRVGLANNEFVLHYQPKVNMRTGKVIGAEALIRWKHPERGLLAPAVFLPVIEEHFLAVDLGEWVIETALTQIEQWHALGLDLPVSVNVGAHQLQQTNFVHRLQALLAAHPQVKPSCLELELLETSALQDIENISSIIKTCHHMGVNFALDDFGTGYSSLTYLKRLPATLLKIDQSFVRDMLDDPEDLAILEGVIGLASAFSREVIAEGVETLAHGSMLLQLGCEQAQGYGIARPMPATAMPDWVRNWKPPVHWETQALMSRDDLPLLFASVEHRAWLKTLQEFCAGEREAPPELDHFECHFGKWLDSAGKARYGAHPHFAQVDALHQQVHSLAEELLQLKALGQHSQAHAKNDQLSAVGDALLSHIKGLERDGGKPMNR